MSKGAPVGVTELVSLLSFFQGSEGSLKTERISCCQSCLGTPM